MTFLKISLVVFSVLSISIFSLSIPSVIAGDTAGCWECGKDKEGHTVCLGVGKGVEQDVSNLKTEFQKIKGQKSYSCGFVCTKECWIDKKGQRQCITVCRGDGSGCDRFLNEMLSPH